MTKKIIKMINLMLSLIILLSIVLPVISDIAVLATTYTITYNRKSNLWRLNSTETLALMELKLSV